MFAPRLYAHYKKNNNEVYKTLRHLRDGHPSPASVWPSWTVNFGPKVCCVKHNDTANLPYGWCAITALGKFDPKKGGHLILWDLGIVIEFPPGSTILIPSSTLTHSNTTILEGEERSSFTMYCSGSLFRWVDNGFKTDPQFQNDHPETWAAHFAARGERNAQVMQYYSTLEEVTK